MSFYTAPPPSLYGSGIYDTLQARNIKAGNIDANISLILPAPLQSIADLPTTANNMLYTIAANTYSTSSISSAGRSFVSLLTPSEQRVSLGLEIGTDVQGQSDTLDNLISISGISNQIAYTTGGNYTNTSLTSYARTSLLTLTSDSELASLIDTISGTISTPDILVKISGPNTVIETGITIDDINNMSGITDLSLTGTLGGITVSERTQLQNINTTTISTTQWGYLGSMNQGLATTDTPTFTGLSVNSQKIISVLNPTNSQDAATKNYVDTVASTGAPPLESVRLSTIVVLPNTPTYSSPAETLTAGSNGALSVDGVATVNGDRILVKDQPDDRENGVYVVTDTGSGATPYILTRASDFNQSVMPVSAGTSVFVEITSGTSIGGSSWSLQTTVNNVDPLTDSVTFIQTGGALNLSAGQGINADSLGGGTVQIENTARFTYSGNAIELSTVDVPYGGTGQSTLASGNVLVGQGVSGVDTSKAAPTGDFVGTTDSQTLTNKTATASTNNLTARGLFTNSGSNTVSTFASANPTTGQVLVATGATTATWQINEVANPDRTIRVYQSAPNSNNNYTSIEAAITQSSTLTPTASNPVTIIVYPGTYFESTPLILPSYVSVSSASITSVDTIVRPTAPAPIAAVFQLNGNSGLSGLYIDGYDGTGAYATVGINSSIGTVGSTDIVLDTRIANCTTACIRLVGDGTPESKKLTINNVRCLITQPSLTATSGLEVNQGGYCQGTDFSVDGDRGISSAFTNGIYIHDDFSLSDIRSVEISQVVNGITVGGGVSSTSVLDYPLLRIFGGTVLFASTAGINSLSKSAFELFNFEVIDNTATYPNQVHVSVVNPSSPANPNLLRGIGVVLRFDLVSISGDLSNLIRLEGQNLSSTPGEIQNQFRGELGIGGPTQGFESSFGEGDSHTLGMVVLSFDGAVPANITSNVKLRYSDSISSDLASTTTIDLTSAPATIDGVTPTSGYRILVKDGSTANPGTTSIDNGIYVWTSAGAAMTRSADFTTGNTYSKDNWIYVNEGDTNYRSVWGLNTNIVVGTTSFSLIAYTSPAFPLTPSNGDVLYIGSGYPLQFPGIKLELTAPLTISSGTSTDALVWEYWNGSAWTSLNIMATLAFPPYTSYSDESFGYDTTILDNSSKHFQIRFPNLEDWQTTTVIGIPGYWIRVRIIDSSIITQVPIIDQIQLGSNHTEFNEDGFQEFFGDSRPIVDDPFPINALHSTGVVGDFTPTSTDLLFSSTNVVGASVSNCTWADNKRVAVAFPFIPYKGLDSSLPLKIKTNWSQGATAGPSNIALLVNYAFVGKDNVVNDGGGTPSPSVSRTTGYVSHPVSTVSRGAFSLDMILDPTGVKNNEDDESEIIWINIIRDVGASGGLDTYSDDIHLHGMHVEYGMWCLGAETRG